MASTPGPARPTDPTTALPTLPEPPQAPFADRRLRLVEAALQVVADGGLRALTHRAVDAQAGLPEGSCSGYFRTRLALLTALTEQVGYVLTVQVRALAERIQAVELAQAQAPDEVRRAAVIEEIVGLFEQLLAAPELVMVQAELGLEARRQPELLTVLQPWRVSLLRIVESIVRDADTAEPDQLAITLVAALEGVVLAGLQEAGGERAAYLRSSVTLLLGGLA
jgi:DNA-binding transcriptional regulator YbjK